VRWYLVVEGAQTERRIYSAWLRHVLLLGGHHRGVLNHCGHGHRSSVEKVGPPLADSPGPLSRDALPRVATV
jgi:hypothetical protein